MSVSSTLRSFFGLESLHTLSAIDPFTPAPSLAEQMATVAATRGSRPWRPATIEEAIGVPAIFRAVSLISNTVGSLAMEAFRNSVRMPDPPQLLKRPDPFNTQRVFYRDSAYYLATRGECWWWVGARDTDDSALSLIVVPPWEVYVTPNPADRLRPRITWLNREIPLADMRHITFLPDRSGLRGVGPLQLCGAAVSVTVEAQEWAANFYADGGHPSILVKSAVDLTEAEAAQLKAQWGRGSSNVPKIISPSIEDVKELGANVQSTQMLEARNHQDGDAARMFGIPGSLLEYAQPGASLTYQNLEGEYTKFVRTCLHPNYLEPIEQEMSDLLSRSTVARFAVAGLMRADIKTRYEVYKTGIDSQIFDARYAAQQEGIEGGGAEFAPVPFSSPQAIPNQLPIRLGAWRCSACQRKIAESRGLGTQIRCRCGALNGAA